MPEALDRKGDRALYLQIADQLREQVVTGKLAPGSRLPSEHSLMAAYDASRDTVRKAIGVLKAEGRLDSERGRGVTVRTAPPVERLGSDRLARKHRKAGKGAYLADLEASGRTAEIAVTVSTEKASREVAARLGLKAGERVLVRSRRMLADGQPLQLAVSYLPLELVKGTQIEQHDTGPGGTYARLEEMGHRLDRFEERVTARMPSPDEAKSLDLGPGTPVILVARTAYAVGNRPVELCDTTMAADRYELLYEISAQ
ncbi:MAG: transcriptional regulator, GntR family [Actinobacteria bacterium]|nr:transcriptional regulator, GntR family [Actinomycetota bacterium]